MRLSLGTSDPKEAKALAEKLLPQLMMRIERGHLTSDSFEAIARSYLAAGRSGEARFVEPLIEQFGDRRINDITDEEIEQHAHSQDWTNATKNRQIITPFNAVANHGAKRKRCMPRAVPKLPVIRRAIDYARDDWFHQVLPHCRPQLAAALVFLTLTGSRASEVCRLTWADCNLRDGWAVLNQTKSGRPRRVELHEHLVSMIAAIPGEHKPDARVFGYAQRWALINAIKRACKRAEAPYLSTHKIGRHAFAARLLARGESLAAVRLAGGWASLGVVADNYGHLEQSHITTALHGAGTQLVQTIELPTKRIADDKG